MGVRHVLIHPFDQSECVHVLAYLSDVQSPSSGATLSKSLLDRSRVYRAASAFRRSASRPPTWLLPSNTVSKETISYRTSGKHLNLLPEKEGMAGEKCIVTLRVLHDLLTQLAADECAGYQPQPGHHCVSGTVCLSRIV